MTKLCRYYSSYEPPKDTQKIAYGYTGKLETYNVSRKNEAVRKPRANSKPHYSTPPHNVLLSLIPIITLE